MAEERKNCFPSETAFAFAGKGWCHSLDSYRHLAESLVIALNRIDQWRTDFGSAFPLWAEQSIVVGELKNSKCLEVTRGLPKLPVSVELGTAAVGVEERIAGAVLAWNSLVMMNFGVDQLQVLEGQARAVVAGARRSTDDWLAYLARVLPQVH
jgi:hypothetical protein